MKSILNTLAIVLLFASSHAFAAINTTPPVTTDTEASSQGQLYAGEGHDEYGGCSKNKWEDT